MSPKGLLSLTWVTASIHEWAFTHDRKAEKRKKSRRRAEGDNTEDEKYITRRGANGDSFFSAENILSSGK